MTKKSCIAQLIDTSQYNHQKRKRKISFDTIESGQKLTDTTCVIIKKEKGKKKKTFDTVEIFEGVRQNFILTSERGIIRTQRAMNSSRERLPTKES